MWPAELHNCVIAVRSQLQIGVSKSMSAFQRELHLQKQLVGQIWCHGLPIPVWKIDPRYLVVEKGFYIVSLLLSSPLSQTTMMWSFTAELSNYSVYSHSPAHWIWLPCPSSLKMLKPVKTSRLPNVVDMLVCTGPLCSISTYEQPPIPEIPSRALLLV